MKIMYIRDEARNPVGVIVYEHNRETDEIKYQYSVCAPSDKFDKEHGKHLATLRFLQEPLHVLPLTKTTSNHDVVRALLRNILQTSKSVRAVQFAYNWWRENVIRNLSGYGNQYNGDFTMGMSKKELAQRLFVEMITTKYGSELNRGYISNFLSPEMTTQLAVSAMESAEIFEREWLDNHKQEVKVPLL